MVTMHSHPSLTSQEAALRLARYGPNVLRQKRPPTELALLVSQLTNPLIIILLAGGGMTVLLRDMTDAAIIFLAVVINTALGFLQERKAQHSLTALKQLLVSRIRVERDGVVEEIDATALVPGDVVMLSAGNRVPGDGVLVESFGALVNESILTGESAAVAKTAGDPVFMGTTVAAGHAVMRVEATGMNTKIGTIAETLSEVKEVPTPLQNQLTNLARILGLLAISVSVAIFALGLLRGEGPVSMFTTAVALAVSAVPEGMVVTLTVILALGMQRILAKKAVVRRLVAAETLGSVTVLCVDKTGTLTEGIMRVTKTHLVDANLAISAAVIANNISDPVEIALWEWAENQDHVDPQAIVENETKITELPFDGKYKFMAVETAKDIWIKGAPEVLLAKSNLPISERQVWQKRIDRMAKSGLRLIAVAHKKPAAAIPIDSAIKNLTFLGIFGIVDPVRPDVRDALDACRSAGVSVKVITGDYRLTAESVLAAIGIPLTNPAEEICEGRELAHFTQDELARRIAKVKLFCRVTPQQKLTIVSALKQNGEVVAMTGDGVNDAMAIQRADIGIVVANASDVARETADMVLLNSSFRTIVAAIEEGRAIFHNIQKVVLYLLSDAFCEILLIAVSLLLHIPLPLTAAQILWINILSDGLPNLALAVDPKESDIMQSKPQGKNVSLFPPSVKRFIAIVSSGKAIIALVLFAVWGIGEGNLRLGQTVVFAFISLGSILTAFSLRNVRKSILRMHPFANGWLVAASIAGFLLLLGAIYHPKLAFVSNTAPLSPIHWVSAIAGAIVFIVILEWAKRQAVLGRAPSQ